MTDFLIKALDYFLHFVFVIFGGIATVFLLTAADNLWKDVFYLPDGIAEVVYAIFYSVAFRSIQTSIRDKKREKAVKERKQKEFYEI
ncbi:MAG: hypothetical protein ACOX6P_05740 [Candidatus Merdivicinus sp.]|jgi:predicted membrane protein